MEFNDLTLSINRENTRNNKATATKEMMAKFKKLSEEYDKIAQENLTNKDFIDSSEDILSFDEEKVFFMINKSKKAIKNISKNIYKLNKTISEYEDYKNNCKELLNLIEKIENIYNKLSDKSNKDIDINVKLDFKDVFTFDFLNKIKCFENDINTLIYKKEEELMSNNKKVITFKEFVNKCITDEDKLKGKNKCNICFINKINICLNPCGHTFCLNCVDKMHNKCCVCRTNFISKIKMFISNNDESDDEKEIESNQVEPFDGFNPNTNLQTVTNESPNFMYSIGV
jgi:hypothetical protein